MRKWPEGLICSGRQRKSRKRRGWWPISPGVGLRRQRLDSFGGLPLVRRRPGSDEDPADIADICRAVATQVCYGESMPSVTSSFRMSKELQRVLADAARRTGKGKNAIIIEALVKHLNAMERESLAEEARRQSELVSRREQDAGWYGIADTS